MVTIKDIAQAANVSVSTVSRALAGNPKIGEKTRKHVKKCAEELGYQPSKLAKSLKDHRTHILGLIIPSIVNPSIPGVVRGIEDAAMERGYMVVLCNMDDNIQKEKKYLDMLQSMWVDGILMATASDESTHLLELKNKSFPVVLLVRQFEEHFDAVCVDNKQSAYKAVKYLLGTGCRKIAIVNGPQKLNLYRERYQGYCAALEESGMPLLENLVWNFPEQTGKSFYEGTLERLRQLTRQERPDAVLAASGPKGPSGPYLLKAVKEFGLKVPEDISIMGFDDLEENAIMDPPITIISQPFYSMGYLAAKHIIDLIENKDKEQNGVGSLNYATLLNTELIVRGSTR